MNRRRTSLAIILSVLLAATLSACASNITRLEQALASPERMAGDAEQDAGRKPAAVLDFLGVEPGMTVLDVMAAGGWYTEALSLAVGPTGKVYAQNPPFMLQFRDGANDKAITSRLKDDRLKNVVRLDKDSNAMGLSGEVDVAITNLNFHDVYNRSPDAAIALLTDIRAALKPGGVLGVIDHNGKEGADNAQLHRMQVQQAIDAATAAGFEVETSDLLGNPDDDLSQMVFSPGLRGNTDRFLLKLTNPG